MAVSLRGNRQASATSVSSPQRRALPALVRCQLPSALISTSSPTCRQCGSGIAATKGPACLSGLCANGCVCFVMIGHSALCRGLESSLVRATARLAVATALLAIVQFSVTLPSPARLHRSGTNTSHRCHPRASPEIQRPVERTASRWLPQAANEARPRQGRRSAPSHATTRNPSPRSARPNRAQATGVVSPNCLATIRKGNSETRTPARPRPATAPGP